MLARIASDGANKKYSRTSPTWPSEHPKETPPRESDVTTR
jgi:hypothetical protein